MSQKTKLFIRRAGIISLKILMVVLGAVIIAVLGWQAWSYFSQPSRTVLKTKNINGTITQTTTTNKVNRDVRNYFAMVATDWRPVKISHAAEGGITIEKYDSQIPLGPSETTVIYDDQTSGPNDNLNTNLSAEVNNNINQNLNNNSSNDNVNTNSSLETNNNINAGNINISLNTNSEIDINENSNTNQPINQNENLNTAVNENTNVNTNINLNENINEGVNNINVPDVNTSANINAILNDDSNVSNQNTNSSQPGSEVLSSDDWRRQVPRGHGFIQANWFCSAAFSHLFLVKSDGTTMSLGDFTGDCTNPSVSVKGNFLPQELPGIDLSQPLNFRISTDWYDGPHINDTSTNSSLCVVDYFSGAGQRDVYAAQYTCDEGLGIGAAHDDLQFTVYAFPSSWTFPKNREDLYTDKELKSDADGDGLSFKQELKLGTNPNNWDTDYDSLGDFEETQKYKTDPAKTDTDGDGFKDMTEVNSGYNPLGSGKATAEQLAAWAATPNQPGKPVISNIKLNYENDGLTVEWDVSPDSDGKVNYGSTINPPTYQNNKSFLPHQRIVVPAASGQAIHYVIGTCSPAPTYACTVTNDAIFQVP